LCDDQNNSGRDSSKDTPTIVFFSGFPDTSDSWSRLATQFEDSHHVIKIAMPDYEAKKLRRFWGYSPEEIVKGLAFVIEPHWKKQSQVILVGHDWGSYICLLYLAAYPGTVHKFVTLDIGIRDKFDLVSICYMTYLAFVFLMSRILPDQLALLFIALYPWKAIGPCPYEVRNLFNRFFFLLCFFFCFSHKIFYILLVLLFYLNIKTDVPFSNKTIKAFMCYPYLRIMMLFFPSLFVAGSNSFMASAFIICVRFFVYIVLRIIIMIKSVSFVAAL
jgi:pimeloyl-ACP methyl ester carboxylesterase